MNWYLHPVRTATLWSLSMFPAVVASGFFTITALKYTGVHNTEILYWTGFSASMAMVILALCAMEKHKRNSLNKIFSPHAQ